MGQIGSFMNRASLHSRAVDALLLLIASIAVTLLWFNNGNLVLGGDVASIPFDPARTATRYLSSWNFWNNAGNPIPAIISNEIPPLDFLFYYSLHLASVPISVAEGVYIVLFSYFLPAISTYSLVSVLFESRIRFSRLDRILESKRTRTNEYVEIAGRKYEKSTMYNPSAALIGKFTRCRE